VNIPNDGAVLPVLHLNGYKINNPTVLARISHDELTSLLVSSFLLVLPDLCDTLLERNRHGLMHAVQVTSLHKVSLANDRSAHTQGMVGSTGG
jgi:hypothetical protein